MVWLGRRTLFPHQGLSEGSTCLDAHRSGALTLTSIYLGDWLLHSTIAFYLSLAWSKVPLLSIIKIRLVEKEGKSLNLYKFTIDLRLARWVTCLYLFELLLSSPSTLTTQPEVKPVDKVQHEDLKLPLRSTISFLESGKKANSFHSRSKAFRHSIYRDWARRAFFLFFARLNHNLAYCHIFLSKVVLHLGISAIMSKMEERG